MFNFFAYISRMKLINRWGLMRNTHLENVQEHSLQVAIVAHALALIKNKYFAGKIDAERVATIAIFHEAPEVITGDLATPIKYFNPEIREAYGRIETVAGEKLLSMLPEELMEEYRPFFVRNKEDEENWQIVKAADKICAYLKCVEELKAGNQEFEKAGNKIKGELESFQAPEVKFFLENFVPGFSLTLDELN